MKPRIGVYLSKRTAARLTTAAKRRGMTKSAFVEAALNRFLGSDDTPDVAMLTDRLTDLSSQIGQLDRDLGIVSEIVALHARFHLTVTPERPAATQDRACKRGAAPFDEFTTQVGSRVERETSLMQETIDRLGTAKPSTYAGNPGEGDPPAATSTAFETDFNASNRFREMPENTAAVREDGSTGDFRARSNGLLH